MIQFMLMPPASQTELDLQEGYQQAPVALNNKPSAQQPGATTWFVYKVSMRSDKSGISNVSLLSFFSLGPAGRI